MRRWLILGTALAGIGAAVGYASFHAFTEPGPLARATAVVVPRGGLSGVASALEAAGVIRSALVFRGFAALTAWQGKLRSAELAFPDHGSLAQVLFILRSGRPVQHLVTIPEGLTSAQLARMLARSDGLDGDIDVPDEGAVLPETYAYARGGQVKTVLQRAHLALEAVLDRGFATRAADVALRSRRELLIVASLVEKETHLPAERARVARVFYNRLSRGMRLQSDPTVVYGESGGEGALARGLTKADLEHATPYNTYSVSGLPAGPICNPGAASIDAAAHPARSAALYFVADGTGGHVFADSLDEHLRNVRRFRASTR
jgi:UPF0755 protein